MYGVVVRRKGPRRRTYIRKLSDPLHFICLRRIAGRPQLANIYFYSHRNLFSCENIIWRKTILDLVQNTQMKTTVSLDSDDLIIDAQAIGAYLMEHEIPDPALVERTDGEEVVELHMTAAHEMERAEPWKTKMLDPGEGLEVLWWPGFDHATIYAQEQSNEKLIEVLVEYSRGYVMMDRIMDDSFKICFDNI